jgi:hypothetical protein
VEVAGTLNLLDDVTIFALGGGIEGQNPRSSKADNLPDDKCQDYDWDTNFVRIRVQVLVEYYKTVP